MSLAGMTRTKFLAVVAAIKATTDINGHAMLTAKREADMVQAYDARK